VACSKIYTPTLCSVDCGTDGIVTGLIALMEVALLVFCRWMDEYAARQSQCPAWFGVPYYD
jgi:hypothetical protein